MLLLLVMLQGVLLLLLVLRWGHDGPRDGGSMARSAWAFESDAAIVVLLLLLCLCRKEGLLRGIASCRGAAEASSHRRRLAPLRAVRRLSRRGRSEHDV